MVRIMERVSSLLILNLVTNKDCESDKSREATPSFALLDIQGPVIVTYVYQLVEGEVRSELLSHLTIPYLPLPYFPCPVISTTSGIHT